MNQRLNELLLQSGATATGNGSPLVVSAYGMAIFQVTGITTATITWEATIDGTNWASWWAFDNTGSGAETASANGIYTILTKGLFSVRARISAYTSGTITVRGRCVAN